MPCESYHQSTSRPKARWAQVLVKVARKINPSVEVGPMSTPSVLVPVIAMAQASLPLPKHSHPPTCLPTRPRTHPSPFPAPSLHGNGIVTYLTQSFLRQDA